MKSGWFFALLSFALLLPSFARAADAPPPVSQPVSRPRLTARQFPELVKYLHEQMGRGKRFPVHDAERTRVDQLLGKMGAQLAGHASIEDLNQQQRIDLLNWQGEVNEILTQAQNRGDRMVCQSQSIMGSHMKTVACISERRRERERLEAARTAIQLERQSRIHGSN